MAVRIEFYGVARLRAGCALCEVEFSSDSGTLGELLVVLASRFPLLARECFDQVAEGGGQFRLKSAYTVNLNSRFVREPGQSIRDGDEVLLLATDAGG